MLKLNARFVERLPKLTEEIARLSMQQEELADEIATSVKELQDYVHFEVEKAELSLELAIVKATANAEIKETAEIKEAQERLTLLQGITQRFSVINSTGTLDFLNDLFQVLSAIEDRLSEEED